MYRILVVDDERHVALTLAEGLEKLAGCRVAVASCGQEALALCSRNDFHLLITDYRMPGMDGLTLVERAREFCPRAAVILITAYSSEELRLAAEQSAVDCVLDKPVGLAHLRRAAMAALTSQSSCFDSG